MQKRWHILLIILACIGILDAGYLTFEHYQNTVPPCTINPLFGDCGKVLRSEYSVILGVPLALVGFVYYSLLGITLYLSLIIKKQKAAVTLVILSFFGFISSLVFVYLQLFVIHAFCLFCMVSALISTILFILTQIIFSKQRKIIFIKIIGFLYQHLLKLLLFKFNPELVHNRMTKNGEMIGRNSIVKNIAAYALQYSVPALEQTIAGIQFKNPVGLAAGFDYEARLTQTLSSIGFGFQSVGTITHHPYGGNPRPLLGRLPKSQSLMVNKGFKNLGARQTIQKLTGQTFEIPVGISIGRTNSRVLMTQQQSVEDIVESFMLFEKSKVKHSYYELNISCPNLFGNVSFYSSKNLKELLTEVDKLHLKRPVFIKMPIDRTDAEVLDMLKVIFHHTPAGVIFGNLQKDRKHPSLNQQEVRAFPEGNFSGKPTFQRSNELIALTYKHFKDRLVIIGCGGIFNAEDAYKKITLGASLVQLITGMIYQGPQLIADITTTLPDLLQKDGFTHISQAIGSRNKK